MFIALCRCVKIKKIKNMVQIDLKFSGVAYGKKINKIRGHYDAKDNVFLFNLNHEYIVYLEFSRIENTIIYGRIIFHQDFAEIRVNCL